MFKQSLIVASLASALAFVPQESFAAGLGKITVFSGLGQPLRAELELNASRDELAGMAARLAPRDAFQQAGVDFSAPLSDLRFAIEKRPDGKSVIKIVSARPINEPFLDFLVELNWPAGRMVREYTFLLDPPEVVVKGGGRSAATIEAKQVEGLPGGGEQPELRQRPIPVEPVKPKLAEKPVPTAAKAEKPAEKAKAAPGEASHTVRSGETLAQIAAKNKPEGVSLDQMLIGLYNANQDAFIGRNMNRLKAGAILNMPTAGEIEATPADEARRLVVAQSNDWNSYRQKLASAAAKAPAREEVGAQSTAGKITSRVEDKAPAPEAAKDQVRVSRTEQAAKSDRQAAAAAAEDRVAHERAMREANERVASLEKNVADLQKLLELKNQKLASLEQNQNKPAATVPVPPPPPKVAEPAPLPPVPPKAAEPAAEEKPAAPAPAAPEAKPEAKPEIKPEAKPEAPPKPAAKPAAPEPEAEAEIGLLDGLPDLALPLAGGGIAALLAGLLFMRRRRQKTEELELDGMSTLATLPESSAFQSVGGQRVDTNNTPQPTGEFSQTGPGTIDTDEVDPVAEADVYMAYGRDAQAEEILLEALNKDPKRLAIHLKLLEIYQGRKSVKQFEGVATELYATTGGVGAEWEKAAAMGLAFDPLNPLYAQVSAAAPAVAQAAELAAEPAAADVAEPVADITPAAEPEREFARTDVIGALAEPEAVADESLAVGDLSLASDLDFTPPADDLSVMEFTPPSEAAVPEKSAPAPVADVDDVLDFDLDSLAAPEPAAEEAVEALDFSLDHVPAEPDVAATAANADFASEMAADIEEAGSAPVAAASEEVLAPASSIIGETSDDPLAIAESGDAEMPSFDMSMTESTVLGETPIAPTFDISSINLDLAAEPLMPEEEAAPAMEAAAEIDPDATLVDEISPEELAIRQAMGGAIAPAEPVVEAPAAEAPVFDEAMREEITTKLDLAKAYEEMGDLEGARELLGEVVADGPPDLADQAREILGRIGV